MYRIAKGVTSYVSVSSTYNLSMFCRVHHCHLFKLSFDLECLHRKQQLSLYCYKTICIVSVMWMLTGIARLIIYWSLQVMVTHFGLTLFCRSPPGSIREIEEFERHICVTREIRTIFDDAYMQHQAKMS